MAPLQQALLIAAAFGTTLIAIYYRFDDYHVTCHLLTLFSIDLVLKLEHEERRSAVLRGAALLGIFAGLSTGTRLNDGAFLALASGIVLAVFARRQRWAAVLVFAAAASLVMLSLILMTGDSVATWADETIFRAAAIKGGTGSILSAPLRFPASSLKALWAEKPDGIGLVITYAVIGFFVLGRHRLRTQTARRSSALGLTTLGVLGIIFQLRHPGLTTRALANSLITWTYVLLIVLGVRLFLLLRRGHLAQWNRREVLFLIPFGQLTAGAMTSGQSPLEAYPTIAAMLLVLPFVFPMVLANRVLRDSFLAILAILAPGTLVTKWTLPYTWHHYYDASAFTGRVWFHHRQYGPMYIERPQLTMVNEICGLIQSDSRSSPELLAVPWPYPNYFCHIPPWHGFVQTWYDTTSRATMQRLVTDLQQQPPEWIAYERGLDTMAVHEKIFLHDARLPHRELDALVIQRLRSGAWSLPFQQCYNGVDWLLIHTRPAGPGEPNDVLLPSTDAVNLCARTAHGYLP